MKRCSPRAARSSGKKVSAISSTVQLGRGELRKAKTAMLRRSRSSGATSDSLTFRIAVATFLLKELMALPPQRLRA